MKMYEVEFTTQIRNGEDPSGNWFNYYMAATAKDAEKQFIDECLKNHMTVQNLVGIREVK